MEVAPRSSHLSGSTGTNRLADFFKIKEGEGKRLALLAAATMTIEAGYWLGGNGLDGIVFSQYGTGALPWLLIAKGLLAFLTLTTYSAWTARIKAGRLLALTSYTIIIGLLIFRTLIEITNGGPVYFLIWPLAYVIPDLLVLQAWALARQSFDSRQSKRLFPLITAGDTVGIVLGNFLTPPLVSLVGSRNLLVIWAVLTLAAFLMLRPINRRLEHQQKLYARKKKEKEEDNRKSILATLRLGYTILRYYKMIGLISITVSISALLYYALWLPYIKVVQDQSPNDPDKMAATFGLVSGTATLTAFFLSLFAVNRLFTAFGIRNFVMFTPSINALGFIIIMITGVAFWPVVAFRFLQLVSMQAISANTTQTLYNLAPADARDIASNFNQGVSRQLGIILAGLLILFNPYLGMQFITILSIVLAIIYFYTAWRIRRSYRPALVQLLKEGQQEFFSSQGDENASIFSLGSSNDEAITIAINGLSDESEGTRRLSAELLGKMGVQEAVPYLLKIVLTDSSAEVRRACILSLAQLDSTESYQTIAQALDDPDPLVRAQAAGALRTCSVALDPVSFYFLRKALVDANPYVRREAVLTMCEFGRKNEALYVLWEMGRDSDARVRSEAAIGYGVIGDTGENKLTREVLFLLRDLDPEVRQNAAEALGNFFGETVINALIAALDDISAAVRGAAARSLARLRVQSIPFILNFLNSGATDRAQAEALNALTLARLAELNGGEFSNPEPAQPAESNGKAGKTKIIHPRDSVLAEENEKRLLDYGERQLALAGRMADYLRSLTSLDMTSPAWQAQGRRPRRDPANLILINSSLQTRYDNAISRAITVIAILGNVEAVNLAGASLRAAGPNSNRKKADAIETLENFGDQRLTQGLIKLLEDEESGHALPTKPRTLTETLYEIWQEHDNWLRACVLHLIGQYSLTKLRQLVERTLMSEGTSDQLLTETAFEAQQRLDFPRDDSEIEKIMLEKDMQTLGTLSTMSRILFLQKVAIFASLSPEDLRRVALASKERLFSPGEIICYEGDPGDELYIIVSGKVQVITGFGGPGSSNQGGGRVIRVASEGEAIGEMAILDDVPRSATLRAFNGPVRLLTLGEEEFKRIMHERPEMAVELIRLLSRWLRETNRRLQQETPAKATEMATSQR